MDPSPEQRRPVGAGWGRVFVLVQQCGLMPFSIPLPAAVQMRIKANQNPTLL